MGSIEQNKQFIFTNLAALVAKISGQDKKLREMTGQVASLRTDLENSQLAVGYLEKKNVDAEGRLRL